MTLPSQGARTLGAGLPLYRYGRQRNTLPGGVKCDVLLRHRSLSIAPWSPGHQRHGFQEPFPVFDNLAMPPLLVEIKAA
jgi:hypothetical protein